MPPAATPAIRRRRAALLAVALAALVCGIIAGARGDDPEGEPAATRPPGPPRPAGGDGPAVDPVGGLTLRQQVGQTVVLRFQGTTLPTAVRDALTAGEAAGVVLFGDNVVSARQLRSLTREIQAAAGESALVATDQEGGAIRILPFAASSTGQPQQGTRAQAREGARQTSRDLEAVGVNVNLAPVADVSAGDASALGDRFFPGDASAVASLVEATVEEYGRGRVAATAKHFPGLGAATANTDDAPATIRRDRETLEREDLEPFRAAIRAGAPLVMASHARYPALGRRRIASQSRAILVDLLRDQLGFDGVVITDSLEAEASLAESRRSVPMAATRAIEAGADLALTTGDASYLPVFDAVLGRAERSPGLRARVEQAAGRVLELKRRLGLQAPAGERTAASGASG